MMSLKSYKILPSTTSFKYTQFIWVICFCFELATCSFYLMFLNCYILRSSEQLFPLTCSVPLLVLETSIIPLLFLQAEIPRLFHHFRHKTISHLSHSLSPYSVLFVSKWYIFFFEKLVHGCLTY